MEHARFVLPFQTVFSLREPALSDVRIRALARRVEVAEDPALTAAVPDRRPARVEVRLAGGRVRRRQMDTPSGEFDRPYPREALREKFLELTAPILGRRGAAAAWSHCEGLEGLRGARELTDGLHALRAAR